MRRLLHEEYPEIFGLVYPRAISGPNSHPSARLVAEELAIPAMLAMPGHEEGFDTVTQYGYATVVGLVAAGMPTYFASRPLLEALLETDPPEDTALAEMPWPHDAALFVLPWDFLVSPDGDCPYLAVARQPGGARVSLPLPGAWTCDMGRAGFSLMTSPVRAEAGSMYGSRLSFEDTPTFAGAMDPRLASMYFPHGMDGGPDGPAPLAEGDGAFNRRLPDLALRLLLYMLARPAEIDRGRVIEPARTKGAKSFREVWSPNFLGRDYRPPADGEDEGRGAGIGGAGPAARDGARHSPRMHWRRRHFRAQRHGPGNSLTKYLWIERTLVGGAPGPAAD